MPGKGPAGEAQQGTDYAGSPAEHAECHITMPEVMSPGRRLCRHAKGHITMLEVTSPR